MSATNRDGARDKARVTINESDIHVISRIDHTGYWASSNSRGQGCGW